MRDQHSVNTVTPLLKHDLESTSKNSRTHLIVLHITIGSILQKHQRGLNIINCSCPVQSGFA